MITPEGDEYWSRLDYLYVNLISGYTAMDAFSDANGMVNTEMPRSKWTLTFADAAGTTLVTTEVGYASAEDLQKSIDMGLEGEMASTMKRLDELLPSLRA